MFSLLLTMCGMTVEKSDEPFTQEIEKLSDAELQKLNTAYFASGCFWCVEAIFESVHGVKEAVSGYSGGSELDPTYEQVGRGETGHTEAVLVYYDSTKISYETLILVYYGSHDPTTVNGQSPDFGTQYRSMIFYQNQRERKLAESYKSKIESSGKYNKPIATEIVMFSKFWKAEEYHQDYEKLHPDNSYVKSVSIPRLEKFKKKFPELLKESK